MWLPLLASYEQWTPSPNNSAIRESSPLQWEIESSDSPSTPAAMFLPEDILELSVDYNLKSASCFLVVYNLC